MLLELGDRRIRVNGIAPDVISTSGRGEIRARTPLARAGHRAAAGWRRGESGGFEV
ncbi:MAG: hypothetical protein JSU66_12265 [Deltaproteobacteria bacterium]|nr:MAG: hypothetical protein JSU66_12265 [Deltaproteobacteria bacterium]